jgi:hypothetical protein
MELSAIFNIIAAETGRTMKERKGFHKIVSLLLFLIMLSFASCDTADICWICENPHNTAEWQTVCSSMTKSKLESYGWHCTPY